MQTSVRHAELHRQHLNLPPELESSSLLPWAGISTIMDQLGLGAGSVLLDLACGRGGYGLEVARRTGAQLIGVDFSTVALARARELAASFGLGGRAEFRPGDLADTGLAAASVDAVMCIDAVQFAEPPNAATRECRRVLRPGGRAVLSCWEPLDRTDDRIPPRLRRMDLYQDLTSAGFTQVRVSSMPEWRAAERTLWEAALAEDPGDDRALVSMQREATRVLSTFDVMQRILATGVAAA